MPIWLPAEVYKIKDPKVCLTTKQKTNKQTKNKSGIKLMGMSESAGDLVAA